MSGVSFTTSLQTATDASFKVNGLTVTRSTNTVSDVIDGITLDLYTQTSGAARLDLNRNTSGIKDNIKGLVTSNSTTPGTNIQAARDVGISLDRYGKLSLDETKLDSALQNNFAEVSTMFSAGTNNQSIYSPAPAGLAGNAINSIEKMLLSTGLIDTQTRNATTRIEKFKEEMTVLEARMEKLMTRYMAQFSVMENIVGNSNSMRDSLKGTFEGMMKAYGN